MKPLDPSLPIYQVKIWLDDIEPLIWRRLQVSDCALADIHNLIQTSFDWEEYHPHVFDVDGQPYSYVDESEGEFADSSEIFLSDLLEGDCRRFSYEYDFGDCWVHWIEIEDTMLPEDGVRYPRCVGGERAGPPEDSGGPYNYPNVVAAAAEPDNAEDSEIWEWLDPGFDPERFDVNALNAALQRMRAFLGGSLSRYVPPGSFEEGDIVRVKPGVVHSKYPDIPLGGWTGTILLASYVIPTEYEVRWSESTLESAHPVFFKRCLRDSTKPSRYFLDEWQIEAAAENDAVQIEQPTEICTPPLSPDIPDDRIRMIFGLTSDDPPPLRTLETDQSYFDYLAASLQFPIEAQYWSDDTEAAAGPVQVTGLQKPTWLDSMGLLCELKDAEASAEVPLVRLILDDDDPNDRIINDYRYWLWDLQDLLTDDDFDDEEDDAYDDFDEDDDDDFDEDEDDDDDFDEDDDEDWDEEEIGEDSFSAGGVPPVKYPMGAVAYYGPDDRRTTKIVAAVIRDEGSAPILQRWVGTHVADSPKVRSEMLAFFESHGVRSVVATDGNMGCPHEEGEDFPLGEDCPFCPWWKGKQGTARRD